MKRHTEKKVMPITLLTGNAADLLQTLPEKSVQCCVTSPPYFGLRDYGLPPTIWERTGDCNHDWEPIIYKHQRGKVGSRSTLEGGPQAGAHTRITRQNHGQFCRLCGAWRGVLGQEPTPDLYITHLREIFRQVHKVLRDDGTLWLNLGDTYFRPKELAGIPWRVALALQEAGWYLRADIIWAKGVSRQDSLTSKVASACQKANIPPNKIAAIIDNLGWYVGSSMPESAKDRPSIAHEYLFLFSKSKRYYYDHLKGKEPAVGQDGRTRNLRSVWALPPQGFKGAHFATFPTDLITPCIMTGTSEHGRCPTCGTPWARMLARGDPKALPDNPNPVLPYHANSNHSHGTGKTTLHKSVKLTTTGWQQTCSCPEQQPQPCVVLDPFAGTGRTGLVATELGRHAILIELSPDYSTIIENLYAEAQED